RRQQPLPSRARLGGVAMSGDAARRSALMPLSYLFLFVGRRTPGGHFALGKRAGAGPDFTRIRTPRTLRKFRLAEYAEHLIHDLLALPVAGSIGEEGQEGVERVLRLRETEPPRI